MLKDLKEPEPKESPAKTFYLVEYATHATYYKVDANSYEELQLVYDAIEDFNVDTKTTQTVSGSQVDQSPQDQVEL